MADFTKLAEEIIFKAKKNGAGDAEIYISRSSSMDIKIKNSEVSETNLAESLGVGIRLIKNKRQGYAYACDLSPKNVEKALNIALRNTNFSDEDPYLKLPAKQNYQKLDLFDEAIDTAPLEEKIALAKEVEELSQDMPYIQKVEHAGFQESFGEVWLYNSKGVNAHEKYSYCALYATLLSEKNGEQDSGSGFSQDLKLANLSPLACAEMSAKRAGRLLGAKSMASAKCAVVFEPYIAAQFISLLAGSFSGENVLKGKSMYAKDLKSQIAPENFSLIDDSSLNGQLGSASFDGEGTAAQRTAIIQQGVLNSFLYDCKAAAQASTVSTANSGRGSYKSAPSIATTNYYVENGSTAPEEIIAQTSYGLYVTNILGALTANTLTGDFSFGASGILIEKGKFTVPIRGVTIAGNLKDILANIDFVGNDLTFFGAEGSPTLRVQNVQISG